MKVKDYIDDARFGTKIIIAETEFYDDGDGYSIVFDGIVGKFNQCKYRECDVDYYRILDNSIELNISTIIRGNE